MSVQKIKIKRNRRREQEKRITAILAGVVLVIVVVFAVFVFGAKKIDVNELEGLWIYDSVTSYEFNLDYHGAMYVNEQKYSFTYKLNRDYLEINFQDETLYDCKYKVSLEDEKLTIEGKDGTTGGVYELVKKNI